MAGDWIKMRVNLDTDPRVIQIACALDIDEIHAVGCLHKLWSWADQHSLKGNALTVTSSFLDRYVRVTGFADALRNVGWLEGRDNALTFPRFAEHNGQTAKTRATTAKRVAKHKKGNSESNDEGNAKGNAPTVTSPLPREEKRREEKKEANASSVETQAIAWSSTDGWSGISDQDREEWSSAYPTCDIDRQLAAMHQWLLSNPAKSKKKQWRRFVTGWLSREQERGGDMRGRNTSTAPTESLEEQIGGRTASIVTIGETHNPQPTADDDIPF